MLFNSKKEIPVVSVDENMNVTNEERERTAKKGKGC